MTEQSEIAAMESGYGEDQPTERPAESSQPETEEAKPAEQEQPVDPLAEIRSQLDRLGASQTKLAGHLGALKQRDDEVRQFMAASRQAANKVADAPTQAQVQKAFESPDEWKQLGQDFPEWVSATEKFLDAKLAGVKVPSQDDIEARINDRVRQQAEAMRQEAAQLRQEQIITTLDAIVDGDAVEVVTSPAFKGWMQTVPGWSDWMSDQSLTSRELANPNSPLSKYVQANPNSEIAQYVSPKVSDAAKLLRAFERSKTRKPEPQKTSMKQRLMAAAVSPKGNGGSSARSPQDDMDAGYNS